MLYNWQRFWYPRGSTIELLDGGYLYRPEKEWTHLLNPDLVPLESLSTIPCLVLLGEPGIGKSHEIEKQKMFAEEQQDEATLWFDLGGYQTDDRLHKELFEHPVFQSWHAGRYRLQLFLDGLDEGLLTISVLVKLLTRNLQKYPVQRLSVRIACRTAEWPLSLEESLKQLWGEENVGVYQLAPLRRVDVSEAAVAQGLNAEQFLDEVAKREVVPLAIKPLTLGFLINIYREKGAFPSTQVELYNEGCRLLCEELSESRRDAGLTGNLDSEQRLAVASRIAALTVFTNRSAVWIGVDQGDAPESDIKLQALWGGKEKQAGYEVEVGESALREALLTGLFSSRGPKRLGWAHRTYAEFLAARYLVQHRVTATQIMSLLVHPDDTDTRLVPQLHETAAWLATMRTDVFRQMMQIDPEVLLRSDVATADEKDRAALVEALLHLDDEARLISLHRHYGHLYGKLLHASLPAQLAPYISGSTFSEAMRLTAIDIAEACGLRTLQDGLVAIVLDSSQPRLIREEAAQAVAHIGDGETQAKLRILAVGTGEDDPNDELKGYALLAAWPTHMTAEELFAALTPPKRENFVGAYHLFLISEFLEHLQPGDLPIALNWVEKLPARSELRYRYEVFFKIVDAIILQAWKHLDTPGVLEALARATLSRVEHFDDIIGDPEKQELTLQIDDDGKRRQILGAVLHHLSERHGDPLPLLYCKPRLLLQRDVPWLIEYLETAETEALQRIVARLIHYAFNEHDADLVTQVSVACENNPILAREFARLPKSVESGSTEAQQMKEHWLQPEQMRNQPATVQPALVEQITTQLNAYEGGDYPSWSYMTQLMRTKPDGSGIGNALESDLTMLPAWEALEEPLRERITEAAKRYVLEEGPDLQVWSNLDRIHYHSFALARYQALYLVLQREPDFIATIPQDVWKRLTRVILVHALLQAEESQNASNVEANRTLVRIAYRHAPAELIAGVLHLIDKEQWECEYFYSYLIRSIEDCWDEHLEDALLTKANDGELAPACIGSLLSALLAHRVALARTFAESLLTLPLPADEQGRQRSLAAACALITSTEDAGWSVVWPALVHHSDFGLKLVAKAAQASRWYAPQLTEDQLADLYIWLARRYPPSKDPIYSEGFVAGAVDSVTVWRDALLNQLKERGTLQACEAIRKIAKEGPELDQLSLRWILQEAQELARRRTWKPFSPGDILKVVNDSQLHLVENGEQLLEAVIESLRYLEAKFRDEIPAWRDVWDRMPVSSSKPGTRGSSSKKQREYKYRPNDENEFSNYVTRHLQTELKQRGVIANREVVIRKAERTDIHVDAVTYTTSREVYDSVSVIIEVKGCWNRELQTAMKAQLVDRYLQDNHCQYGLYLIGWFNSNEWDSEDYRKGDAPNITIDEAQRQFDVQAAELSQQGIKVRALVLNAAVR